ncbi:MAG: hypothetical protein ABH857_01990 [Elusimicrobiota bacterium]
MSIMKEILAYISVICVGAGVPIVLFVKAFENVDKLSGFAWIGVSLVSGIAIICSVIILGITRSLRQK